MTKTFNRLYPFRRGSFGSILLNQNDPYVRGAVEHFGEFSEAEVDVFRDILTPRDWVVEVGANMGAHSVALSGYCERLYCFEPQRFMFQTLCANLALNSIDNAIARQIAIGSTESTVRVPCLDPYTQQNFGSFSLRAPYEEGDYIQQITLDSLVFPRLDLLKLDCEGSELSVLLGASATIQKHRPWIYLEFAENRAGLLHVLESYGYSCIRHVPPLNRWPNFLDEEPPEDEARLASDMVLAIPMDRLPRAPMIGNDFGVRHGWFLAKDEELLGHTGMGVYYVTPYPEGTPVDPV